MRLSVLALGIVGFFASPARADVELENDQFSTGATPQFQPSLAATESAASRFIAPAAGRQLMHVQLLFGGGSTATRTITLEVYDDTAGTNAPGTELYSKDFALTGSDAAIQDIQISDMVVTVPAQFRVAIRFGAGCPAPPNPCGAPTVANDTDSASQTNPTRNFLFVIGSGWITSASAGVNGDWIIRAFVSDPTTTLPDAGVVPDSGSRDGDGGDGGNGPNGNNSSGGGCCQAGGTAQFGAPLGLLVLALASGCTRRRRRSRRGRT